MFYCVLFFCDSFHSLYHFLQRRYFSRLSFFWLFTRPWRSDFSAGLSVSLTVFSADLVCSLNLSFGSCSEFFEVFWCRAVFALVEEILVRDLICQFAFLDQVLCVGMCVCGVA